jgi:hypothetical protein
MSWTVWTGCDGVLQSGHGTVGGWVPVASGATAATRRRERDQQGHDVEQQNTEGRGVPEQRCGHRRGRSTRVEGRRRRRSISMARNA